MTNDDDVNDVIDMIGFYCHKYILRIEPALSDLKDKDEVYYKSLMWMLENNITDVVYETFTTTTEYFGVVSTIELRPNGANIELFIYTVPGKGTKWHKY